MSSQAAERLTSALRAIWQITVGSEVGALESDLTQCRKWFDPVAQGQRLRREFASLAPIPQQVWVPGPPWTFQIDADKHLVTPEGRCALDLLEQLPPGIPQYLVTDRNLQEYDRLLAHLYREWSRHRITSVVDLLAGDAKPLQLPAAAVVLALLINRSTSKDRAMKRFPAGPGRELIDRSFFEAVEAFWNALTPKQRPTRDPRLISGWMLYEARRRLGNDVLIIEDSRPDATGRIWIDQEKWREVVDVVARDLSRGHRPRVTKGSLANAFELLVKAFRSELPTLAGYGLAHERPANTDKIRTVLLDKFERYITED